MTGTYFVKNPNRRKRVVKQERYTPEHQKLGVSPIEYPLRDPEEFARNAQRYQAKQKAERRNRDYISLVQEYRDGKISKQELESVIGKVGDDAALEEKHRRMGLLRRGPIEEKHQMALDTEARRQKTLKNPPPMPVSGQSEEHLWTRGLSDEDDEDEEDEYNNTDDYYYNDIPEPPEKQPVYYPEPPSLERDLDVVSKTPAMEAIENDEIEDDLDEEESFSLNQVEAGNFVLLLEDSVIAQGRRPVILKALKEALNTYQDVKLRDFVVLKRVNLYHGFHIDE
jgi:hypothetical protein